MQTLVRTTLWHITLITLLASISACETEETAPPRDPSQIVPLELTVGDMKFGGLKAGVEDGPLVILLHGFPETSHEWEDQLVALGKEGYLAIAPDQRGYSEGASPDNVEDYAMPLLVGDVLGMADSLGREQFHLVGHDWGAAVTWSVATEAPDRVISATAISIPHPAAFDAELADPKSCQYKASYYFEIFSTPDSESLLLADNAGILRTVYAGLPEETVEFYLDRFSTPESLKAPLNWYRANTDMRRLVGPPQTPVTVPTLFIWSDEDIAVCEEPALATEDYVTAPYRFETIQGVNHWVVDLAGDQVTDYLLQHL